MPYTFREAFRLSSEEIKNAKPVGTIDLSETRIHDTKGEKLRLPVPSNDPADPLNWATWRKSGILFTQFYYAFIGNFIASSIGSALPVLGAEMHVPFSQLSYVTSVTIVTMGCWNLIGVPLGNTFGRRTTVLGHLVVLLAGSIWALKAPNFGQLLAARVVLGLGISVSETIGPDIVGEVFFVHDQGAAMTIYTAGLSTGSLIGGITGSFIAAHGLKWVHWTNLIMAVCCIVLCFFLQPETMFDRNAAMLHDITGEDDSDKAETQKLEMKPTTSAVPDMDYAPFTWKRALAVGQIYRPGFLEKLFSIVGTLRLPGLWLVMLWYSGLTSGVIIFGITGPTLMSAPPYNWGSYAGLISAGGFLGTIAAVLYSVFVSNKAMTRAAKKTSGLYEPESRLASAFPGVILATLGIWIFGFTAANPGGVRWLGMEFGQAMVTFGLTVVPTIGFTYILDCYFAISSDCFTMAAFFRSIISFAWSFFVNDWVADRGYYEPFGIFGGFEGLTGLLTFVIIIWGKRFRIATEKWVPVHDHH